MEENKDIQPVDKLFRQSLEGHSPVPPPSVWKSIKVRRLSKDLSSAGKWLTNPGGLTVISVAVLVATSWIIYKSFIAEPQNTHPVTEVREKLINFSDNEQPIAEGAKSSGRQVSGSGQNSSQVNNSPIGKSPVARKTVSSSASSKKSTADMLPVNKSVSKPNTTEKAGRLSPASDKSRGAVTRKSPNVIVNPKTIHNQPENIDPTAKTGTKQVNDRYKNLESNNALHEAASAGNNKTVKAEMKQSSYLKDEAIQQNGVPASAAIGVAPLVNDTLREDDNLKYDIKANPSVESSMAKTNDNSGGSGWLQMLSQNMVWQVAAYGSSGQVYQKYRNTNPFYGGMITGGLWNTKLKAGIETGIGLAKYKDYGEIKNHRLLTEVIITNDTTWIVLDSVSVPKVTVDSSIRKTYFTDSVKYNYDYTYLQIPFFITKQIAKYGKLSLDLKAGPAVSFIITKKESIDANIFPDIGKIFNSSNTNYTRLNISWQLHIAPQLRWDISENLSIGISPAAVLFLNNLYDKKNRPSSKPYSISITGGISYKFH